MSSPQRPTAATLASYLGDDALSLAALLEEAQAVQFERSRRPGKVEEIGRSKGTATKPTEDTALDPIRLALREEVQRSLRLIISASRDFRVQVGRLERALEAWRGEAE